jgi:hypothetical protein
MTRQAGLMTKLVTMLMTMTTVMTKMTLARSTMLVMLMCLASAARRTLGRGALLVSSTLLMVVVEMMMTMRVQCKEGRTLVGEASEGCEMKKKKKNDRRVNGIGRAKGKMRVTLGVVLRPRRRVLASAG